MEAADCTGFDSTGGVDATFVNFGIVAGVDPAVFPGMTVENFGEPLLRAPCVTRYDRMGGAAVLLGVLVATVEDCWAVDRDARGTAVGRRADAGELWAVEAEIRGPIFAKRASLYRRTRGVVVRAVAVRCATEVGRDWVVRVVLGVLRTV